MRKCSLFLYYSWFQSIKKSEVKLPAYRQESSKVLQARDTGYTIAEATVNHPIKRKPTVVSMIYSLAVVFVGVSASAKYNDIHV